MRLRRIRSRLPLWLTVAGLFGVGALYVFGMAKLQSIRWPFFQPEELWGPRFVDALIASWVLWVGCAIGSFLNVIAWRMPRGININGHSHCPRCHVRLRSLDNFPVLGWISRLGRCRACRLPISTRYPIVEAAVGISIAAIGVHEIHRMAIPGQWTHWHGGPLWAPVVDGPLLILLVYHITVLATSWAFGLIRYDRNGLPGKLLVFAFVAVVIPPLVYPTLMVVPWQTNLPHEEWTPDGKYYDAVMRVITALAAAAIFGRSLARGLCPTADPKLDPLGSGTARLMNLIAILALPAVVVGWQAFPALIVLASLIALVLRRVLPRSTDVLGCFALAVPIALTIQLCLWRRLHFFDYWPSVESPPWLMLAWGGAVLVIPAWLREPPEPVVPVDTMQETDDEDAGEETEEDPARELAEQVSR